MLFALGTTFFALMFYANFNLSCVLNVLLFYYYYGAISDSSHSWVACGIQLNNVVLIDCT